MFQTAQLQTCLHSTQLCILYASLTLWLLTNYWKPSEEAPIYELVALEKLASPNVSQDYPIVDSQYTAWPS